MGAGWLVMGGGWNELLSTESPASCSSGLWFVMSVLSLAQANERRRGELAGCWLEGGWNELLCTDSPASCSPGLNVVLWPGFIGSNGRG